MNPIFTVLFGNSLSCLGTFIALPLFGLHLAEGFQLQPAYIGFYSAIWPATVFFSSSVFGMLADKWGYHKSIPIGLFTTAIGFAFMGLADQVHLFAIGMVLFGLGKSFFDSSIRAALCRLVPEKNRERIFRYRYMILNISCILGPILSVWAYRTYKEGAFFMSSGLHLIFMILSLYGLPKKILAPIADAAGADNKPTGFFERFSMLKNFQLASFILSGTLILACYGVYESLMPVVIAGAKHLRPEFGFMLSMNGATVILMQLIHVRFLKNLSAKMNRDIGFAALLIGFGLFAVPVSTYAMTLAGVVVFSIGESFLFPVMEIIIDKMAPQKSKAAFFGASELKQAGFFIGPAIGGLILQYGSVSGLFIVCSIMSLISWIVLANGVNVTRPVCESLGVRNPIKVETI